MAIPEAALLTRIEAAGYGTAGTDLFSGGERPADVVTGVPVEATFCRNSGGPPPRSWMNARAEHIRLSDVQIIVRGKADTEETLIAKARNIMLAVTNTVPAGFLDCEALQSNPVDIGRNDKQEPRFVVNVRLWSQEA
jgi:hypothetical protein